jgi:ubiquinone/menaquinone biosynthesis C-methylase UbiE
MSAERLELRPGARVLDLCCGTGLSTAALLDVCPSATVVGLDISPGMIALARTKGLAADFVVGDAMSPAVEGPFDAILVAYGIRNLPDVPHGLDVVRGLLAPDAPVCFHEYSVADSWGARVLFNTVALGIIIPAGYLTSRHTRVYRYLRHSVNEFDGVRAFEDRLYRHGFVDVRTLPMDGWQRDIVHSFLARRPA